MQNNINLRDLQYRQNKEVIDAGNLVITKNSIYFNNSVLQISNINYINITKFLKDPFPAGAIFGIIIGVLTLWLLIGIIILAISIFSIYKYYKNNKNDKFGLHIQMSSGFCMTIGSEDYSFLIKVKHIISNNFVENNNLPTTINLDNKHIVIKKNEGIVNTGDFTHNRVYQENENGNKNRG